MWRLLSTLQWRALQLAKRSPLRKRDTVDMFFPAIRLHHLGVPPSWVYKDIFVEECYSGWGEGPYREIVDLGGNLGLATLYFLKRYPGARITTVEANPHTVERLQRNLASFANVSIEPVAVAAEPGELDLWIDHDSASLLNASITGRDRWTDHKFSSVKVKAVTLDEILPTQVDLMKVDIEGAEYDVLKSECVTGARIKRIVLEAHDLDRRWEEFQALRRSLEERGFRCVDGERPEPWPSCTLVRFEAAV